MASQSNGHGHQCWDPPTPSHYNKGYPTAYLVETVSDAIAKTETHVVLPEYKL